MITNQNMHTATVDGNARVGFSAGAFFYFEDPTSGLTSIKKNDLTDLTPVETYDPKVDTVIRGKDFSKAYLLDMFDFAMKLAKENGMHNSERDFKQLFAQLSESAEDFKLERPFDFSELAAQYDRRRKPTLTAKMNFEVSVLVIPPAQLIEKLKSLKVLVRRDGDNSIINGACMDIDRWIKQLERDIPLMEPTKFGAMVEAKCNCSGSYKPEPFVLVRSNDPKAQRWYGRDGQAHYFSDLINPILLSEGVEG